MSIYDTKSDEELITLLREGDEKVTDFIMEKYKDLVRKKAGTMYIIGADKDDLIQEGMIGLYRAIRDYDYGRDASFQTFADLCVSRQMYKAVEAGNRKKHMPLNSYVSIDGESNGDEYSESAGEHIIEVISALSDNNPEKLFIDRENTEVLEQKIYESLSEFERQVLSLHMTGMGYAEISKVLGRDEKSADNALNRIKSKVKKILISK